MELSDFPKWSNTEEAEKQRKHEKEMQNKETKIKEKEIVVLSEQSYNLCEGGGSPPKFTKGVGLIIATGEERTEKQKQASKKHSEIMKGKSPWNTGKTGVQKAWNKGVPNPDQARRAKEVIECPHCKKTGGRLPMLKWHFDNCKFQVGA